MKYLFVNASLTDGGSEKVMVILANRFADSGLDTSMLLLREKKASNYKVSSKLKCCQLKYGKYKTFIILKRFIMTRKYIKKLNPDVIISFMWDINVFTLLACLGLHKRVIISERAHPKDGINNKLRKACRELGQRYIYLLADRIILQTEQVRKYYRLAIQRKCIVIPNPISPNLPEIWDYEREKKVVAAGRFTPQKNFQMLIRAFAAFHEKHPEYELVIYGEGSLRAEYTKLIEELGINDFVSLPGYILDVSEKMCMAAIYVSTSDFEGISNSMLEALAMGIPSICTDCPVGGAAMAIENGVNGILIPIGAEERLSEALTNIANNRDYAMELSRNAIKIRDKLSLDMVFECWKGVIKALI